MSLLRAPITQFFILGLVIYGGYLLSGAGDSRQDRIVVDKNALLTFLQYRSQAFDSGRAERAFNALSESDRKRLIQNYVREEVLYREALALGLSENDYIIRSRLVQKMEFLAGESIEPAVLSETELQAYFNENRDDYFIPPSLSFTHVFARDGSSVDLDALRESLDGMGVAEALAVGDRFPYHRNYSDSGREAIAAHFGTDFAEKLFTLPVGTWQGPIASAYGQHFVYLISRTEGSYPTLDEVIREVTEDAGRVKQQQQLDEAVEQLATRYDIIMDI